MRIGVSHKNEIPSYPPLRVTETARWLEWQDWAETILKQPYEIKNSELHIPDVPGVGLEWDGKVVSGNLAEGILIQSNPLPINVRQSFSRDSTFSKAAIALDLSCFVRSIKTLKPSPSCKTILPSSTSSSNVPTIL